MVFWHVSVSPFFPFGKKWPGSLRVTWVILSVLWIIKRSLFLFLNLCRTLWVSLMAHGVKNPSAIQETQEMQVWSLGQENPLKEENGNLFQYSLWPFDCSPPGSSVHRIFQARILEQVAVFLLQRIFLTQGSNLHLLCLLNCRWILYPMSH